MLHGQLLLLLHRLLSSHPAAACAAAFVLHAAPARAAVRTLPPLLPPARLPALSLPCCLLC